LHERRRRATTPMMPNPLSTPFVDTGLTSLHIHLSLEITGVVIAITAIMALTFGGYQVVEMRKGSRNQELQTRAGVLLGLDERWERAPMLSCRADLEVLIDEVKTESATCLHNPCLSEIRKRIEDLLYANRLAEIAELDRQRYARLMRICGFFETVGCVARAGYVPPSDVLNLLSISIISAGWVFRPHIRKLLAEGAPNNFFENFLWIVEQSEREQETS
jgi:hypothetical protein